MITIPLKEVPILRSFLDEHEVIFAKYTVKKIKKAVNNDLGHIELFRTEDKSIRAWVDKSNYIAALEKALRVLVKEEEYEIASITKKLIDTIQINNLIKETVRPEE